MAKEKGADQELVELGTLLRDVDDIKLTGKPGDENALRPMAKQWIPRKRQEEALEIIHAMSFKGTGKQRPESSESYGLGERSHVIAGGLMHVVDARHARRRNPEPSSTPVVLPSIPRQICWTA